MYSACLPVCAACGLPRSSCPVSVDKYVSGEQYLASPTEGVLRRGLSQSPTREERGRRAARGSEAAPVEDLGLRRGLTRDDTRDDDGRNEGDAGRHEGGGRRDSAPQVEEGRRLFSSGSDVGGSGRALSSSARGVSCASRRDVLVCVEATGKCERRSARRRSVGWQG